MKCLRNNKAITLIALVITIIILIILAGVTINLTIGNNGLFTRAKETKNYMTNAEKSDGETINEILDTIEKETGEKKKGKPVAELYDGINDNTNENYNENAMHIGDWVDYHAGTWEETKEAPESYQHNNNFYKFGGYTEGQSRDTNASGYYTMEWGKITYGIGEYEGWRIWDILEDNKTVILVSAGCPEVFSYYGGGNAYNAEKILLGETSGEIDETKNSTPRNWDCYINYKQYASNARLMKKSDIDSWSEKANNKLTSVIYNGFYYWLGNSYISYPNKHFIYFIDAKERKINMGNGASTPDTDSQPIRPLEPYGIRILVTINSEASYNLSNQKIEHDGFTYNKWIIE